MESLKQRVFQRRLPSASDIAIPLISSDNENKLKKTLGVGSLLGFGIAGTAGAGIFVTTGVASHQYAGAAISLSVLLAGFACMLDGLCYADVASKIPEAGSVYSYAFHHFGELPAFLMAGVLLLEYGISGCATARGCANYIVSLFNALDIPTPRFFEEVELPAPFSEVFSIQLLPFIIILMCSVIAARGMEESSFFTNCISLLNLGLMATVIIMGSMYFKKENFTPFLLPNQGIPGIVEGSAIMMFCFLGFDACTTLAEETKNPSKTIPLALLGTLVVVGIVYSLMSTVLVGMIPPLEIDQKAAVSAAFLKVGSEWQSLLVCVGATLTSFVATLTCVVGQSRIFYRMAKDGMWFRVFKQVDRNGCPSKGVMISAFVLATAAGTMNFDFLIRLISAGTLLSFSLVNVAVLKSQRSPRMSVKAFNGLAVFFNVIALATCFFVRSTANYTKISGIIGGAILLAATALPFTKSKQQDSSFGTFNCPFVPWVPLAGMIVNAFLIASLQWVTFLETTVFLLGTAALWVVIVLSS